MPSAQELVRHFAEHQQRALSLYERWEKVLERLQAETASLTEQAAAAAQELAAAYLPTLDAPALQRAEALTGFRGFSRRSPLDAMAREKAVLERTVRTNAADERYIRREYLVGPHGEHTRALEEARSLWEPWQQECAKFEDQREFHELIKAGYDTPDFKVAWWDPLYWRLWARGDAVCENLGFADFGDDVLPAYHKVAAERAKWQGELDRIGALIDAVHALVRDHDQAVARIPRLPEIYLESSQKYLATFLDSADLALLAEWLDADQDADRAIRMGLRKLSGLQAKVAIVDELRSNGVEPFLKELRERAAKYARKQEKFSRSKYWSRTFPASYLDTGFSAKEGKYRERADKIEHIVQKIVIYDHYQRFDLANDPNLWWYEFTGKYPLRLTPGLRGWYDRHPAVRPAHDPLFDDEAVAVAAAARDLDDLGYLS